MNAREWFDASLSFFFVSLSGGKGMAGLTRGRTSLLPFHMCTREGTEALLREFLCVFVCFTLFVIFALFSFRMCLDHFAHGVFPLIICGFVCSHLVLCFCSFCCLLRESFAVLEQCYSTTFFLEHWGHWFFFRYSERVVSFTFFSRLSLLPIFVLC